MSETPKDIMQVFEEVVSKYMNTIDSNEITSKLIRNVDDESKMSASAFDMLSQSQEDFSNIVHLRRIQIETLITQTEARLKTVQFLDLILSLGFTAYSLGEVNLSIELFEFVINRSKKDPMFIDFEASAYLGLGDVYHNQAYWQKSLNNLKKAKDIYLKQKYMPGAAKCENVMGAIYGDKGNFVKAKEHFQQGLAMLNHKKDKFIIAMIETNLANVYLAEEKFDDAFTYFYRALTVFEQVSDFKRVAMVRCNLGTLFVHKNEYDPALNELDLSLTASIKAEFIPNLGVIYSIKASIFAQLGDFPLAIAFSDKAMEICYKINDRITIADIYKIKGIIQRKLNNYQLAENYLQTSLRLNKKLSNEFNAAETSYELGLLYIDWKRSEDAKNSLKESLKYKKKVGATSEISKIEKLLIDISN